jgi:hypothetical protein
VWKAISSHFEVCSGFGTPGHVKPYRGTGKDLIADEQSK